MVLSILLVGCKVYSFTGVSLDPDLETITVASFPNESGNGPGNVGELFTETLKQKMLSSTNLRMVNGNADVAFTGQITDYRYSIQAPSGGQTSDLQRITMVVKVSYTNRLQPEENWEQSMSQFIDYPVTEDLSVREEAFIQEICDLLVEEIFNKSFVKW